MRRLCAVAVLLAFAGPAAFEKRNPAMVALGVAPSQLRYLST